MGPVAGGSRGKLCTNSRVKRTAWNWGLALWEDFLASQAWVGDCLQSILIRQNGSFRRAGRAYPHHLGGSTVIDGH